MPDHGEGNPFLHPTLRKSIHPADYSYILKLKLHLTATNYTTWRTVIYQALQTESLHLYLDPTFACPDVTHNPKYAIHWGKANLFVCTVLTSTMMEEIAVQIGHIQEASEMWEEAKHVTFGPCRDKCRLKDSSEGSDGHAGQVLVRLWMSS